MLNIPIKIRRAIKAKVRYNTIQKKNYFRKRFRHIALYFQIKRSKIPQIKKLEEIKENIRQQKEIESCPFSGMREIMA